MQGAFGDRAKTETCGVVRETDRVSEATELNVGLRVGVRQRSNGAEPNDQGTPQLNPGRRICLAPNFDGTGNWVSVKRCQIGWSSACRAPSENGHRPPRRFSDFDRRKRRDGRCKQVETKANARRTTSGGSVHLTSSGRCADFGLAALTGALLLFRPAPAMSPEPADRARDSLLPALFPNWPPIATVWR